jgi:hypothetical protein
MCHICDLQRLEPWLDNIRGKIMGKDLEERQNFKIQFSPTRPPSILVN